MAYNKTVVNSRTVDDVAGNRRVTTTTYRIHDVAHLQAGVCTDCVVRDRKLSRKLGIVSACCLPVIVGLIAMSVYLSDNVAGWAGFSGVVALVLIFVVGPFLTLFALHSLHEGAKKHVSLDYLVSTFKSDIMKGRTESDFSSLFTFMHEVR